MSPAAAMGSNVLSQACMGDGKKWHAVLMRI